MKRLVLLVIVFIILCFSIPIIFTSYRQTQEVIQNNTNNYEYKSYKTVKLLHEDTGEIKEMDIDEYLLRSCVCGNAS